MPAENAPTRRIGADKPRLSLLTGAGNNKAIAVALAALQHRPSSWWFLLILKGLPQAQLQRGTGSKPSFLVINEREDIAGTAI
jgi:hypothetical protein